MKYHTHQHYLFIIRSIKKTYNLNNRSWFACLPRNKKRKMLNKCKWKKVWKDWHWKYYHARYSLGSLFCTTSMDKLGQLMYKNDELMYKYKGVVETQPCYGGRHQATTSSKAVISNAVSYKFICWVKETNSEQKQMSFYTIYLRRMQNI